MPNEEGKTNLGPIPPGMGFYEATVASRPRRKYRIDPYSRGDRLTICSTIRNAWRVLDALPDSPEKSVIQEYLTAAFDYGKRMDARLRELKARLGEP